MPESWSSPAHPGTMESISFPLWGLLGDGSTFFTHINTLTQRKLLIQLLLRISASLPSTSHQVCQAFANATFSGNPIHHKNPQGMLNVNHGRPSTSPKCLEGTFTLLNLVGKLLFSTIDQAFFTAIMLWNLTHCLYLQSAWDLHKTKMSKSSSVVIYQSRWCHLRGNSTGQRKNHGL